MWWYQETGLLLLLLVRVGMFGFTPNIQKLLVLQASLWLGCSTPWVQLFRYDAKAQV
jgi:hypothetical protein